MAKKINKTELAKKYASALFDEAVAHDQADAVAEEMRGLVRLMSDCPEFKRLFSSQLIGMRDRRKGIDLVAEKIDLSDLMHRFFLCFD